MANNVWNEASYPLANSKDAPLKVKNEYVI